MNEKKRDESDCGPLRESLEHPASAGRAEGRADRPAAAKDSLYISLGVYGAVGFQLALAVVGGLFLGNALDKRLGSGPWLALAGLTLGFAGGLWNLIRLLSWHRQRKGG